MSLGNLSTALPAAAQTPIGIEVMRGLGSRPKTLSPWLFYDERGSQLFEQITELPEYYLTRTERGIFSQHASDILAAASQNAPLTLIELGAGSASKTGLLLHAALARQTRLTYHAMDVSASALNAARENLSEKFPTLTIETHVGDYTQGLDNLPSHNAASTRRLILYIGSSIGNFDPCDAENLLRHLHRQLLPGDRILLGVDHVKPVAPLLAAYNDKSGVTAAFNRNVLIRINRELGADFQPDAFEHRAIFNAEESRIEMHLVSTQHQYVSIPALDLKVALHAGEPIHTENSYKFTPESATALLAAGGFTVTHSWTDHDEWFGVYLATVA